MRVAGRRFSPTPFLGLPYLCSVAIVLLLPTALAAQSLPQVPGISIRGPVDDPAAAPKPPAAATPAPAPSQATSKPAAPAPSKEAAKPASKPASKPAAKSKQELAAKDNGKSEKRRGQSIAILVNDDPITAYEIEQRAAFISLSAGNSGDMKSKAEARWQSIIKDPKTNERFKQLLRDKGVRTQEEARALQTQYIKDLQRNMMDGLRREMRQKAVSGSREKAQDELIDEKLKIQEAKRLSVLTGEDEIDKVIGGIAERNKMTLAQFGQHMKTMGVDIATMRSRFRAEISWRDVVRRRFGHQITIADRDVDRLVANDPAGEEDVELQLQRIAIFTPPNADQKAVALKLSEAQSLATRFTGCGQTKELAAQLGGARFEDLGTLRPSNIPEPTRSMLLNARDGNMLPPTVAKDSIELWVVCGRKTITANEQKRENAEAELRQKEFEIMARKHLKDLRQDAAIEYR